MKIKIPLGIALTFVILAASASFAVTAFTLHKKYNSVVGSFSERSLQYEYLAEVDSIVRNNYYGDIDEDSLKLSVVSGYVMGLNDSECMFLSADEYESYQRLMKGFKTGCGIVCSYDSEKNALSVVSVASGSSADNEGIKTGSFITAVDGESVSADNCRTLISKLSDSEDGEVELTFLNNKQISLTFGYTEKTVTYSTESGVGYIRVPAIFDGTSELFRSALESLKGKNTSKIIIDLRNNSGYNYDEAAEMIDMLVPVASSGNKAIAIIGDKNGNSVKSYDSDADCYTFSSVAVIVNSRTSGAAELIATDLAQFGKAEIYGEQTAGIGKVISEFSLSDGNIMFISTGVIKPYIGETFDGIGVTPDTEITMTEIEKNSLDNICGTENDTVYTAVVSALTGK